MKGKRVVITGGCGFIGSHIAERLCEENEVIVLDNAAKLKKDNITNPRIRVIDGDILDFDVLKKSFQGADYVFHEAATTSVQKSIENPALTFSINTGGTINVLNAANECGVKKVIYASSAAVYGDSEALPKKESMTPEPKSPYAASKLCSEQHCRLFNETFGLSAIVLRYFNVFGPRQDVKSQYAAVIPRFITSMLNGEKPQIFGDGSQTRDFVFVEDVVNANILAAKADVKFDILNIASGKKTSINDLVNKINKINDTNIESEYKEKRPGDILHSVADISKAREIGYEPKKDLEQGLRETIEWLKACD